MTPESVIRTIVPVIVGLILTQLLRLGFDIDEASLTAVLNGLLISAYYVLVRWVGERYPAAEWLLGSPKTPAYDSEQGG